ncbi:MAG: hypothetical protein PHO10_11060, partial [Gemmiger sp.]|nr:hypothetical protein [Gemmiger sp.]
MLKPLRRRLTALFTVLTALVLSAAIGFAGQLAARQQVQAANNLLATTFAAIQDRFAGTNTVSDHWLARQESENGCLLYLEDNGAPLAFSATRQQYTALFAKGKAAFEAARPADGQPHSLALADETGHKYNGLAVF